MWTTATGLYRVCVPGCPYRFEPDSVFGPGVWITSWGASWSARPADVRPAQEAWDKQGRARLRQLLQGDEQLACPAAENPTVSFIVVLHNRAHLSLLSLESVIANADVSYELIVVDNASTDETGLMLDRLQGAKIIRNPTNVGFGPACMQAAACAAGEYLCFFNNDALLSPTAISAALANFAHASVGAVGGKVLLANGALQEAGNIVWSDGSALGYGRGDDPQAPPYDFRRPVDYCSGSLLADAAAIVRRTRRIQFRVRARILRRYRLLHDPVAERFSGYL